MSGRNLTQSAGAFIGTMEEFEKRMDSRPGTLIHILDKQHDEIIGTLNTKKGQVNEPLMTRSIENFHTFDMRALAHFDKLTKRNRLLVQDVDGFFEEFIITYARQYKRNEKEVRSIGSFIDLRTAKVIEPQYIGDTPKVCVDFALSGTEIKTGNIAYTGNLRNLKIEEHTEPYSLMKLIASTFNLELRYRIEVEGNRITRYADMVEQIAGFEGKEITFGKDLIGINRVEDSMNIVTALVGLGPIREDGTRLEVYVENQEALERWGRNGRHLVRVYEPQSIDEDMTEDRLRTLTENELEKRIDAVVTYECQAVSLESVFGRSHEKIRLGQTVRIKDDGYTPPLYLEARIREATEDVSTRAVVDFKIGNYIEFNKDDLEREVKVLRRLLAKKIDDVRLQSAIEQAELELETYIEETAERKIPVQPTPPDHTVYEKWIDTSIQPNVLKTWDDVDWIKASPTEASEIGAETPHGAQNKADAAKQAAAVDATQKAESAESNAKSYADSQDTSVYQDATIFAEQIATTKSSEAQSAAEQAARDYTDENAVIVGKQYTNGLLWSELLGLIVARSDGKVRSGMSSVDGFYIEQKQGDEWIKVFYTDTNGNGVFSGDIAGSRIFGSVINLLKSGTFKATASIATDDDTSFLIEDGLFKGSIGKRDAFFGWFDGDRETYKGFTGIDSDGFVTLILGNGTLDNGVAAVQLGNLAIGKLDAASVEVEPYQSATLLNGWITHSEFYYPAQFMKDPMGFVHLRGRVKDGVLEQQIFRLPIGYRPSKMILISAMGASSGSQFNRVIIHPTGEVIPYGPSNSGFSIEGITFMAEQ